jgi:signal transduction histidine kinase
MKNITELSAEPALERIATDGSRIPSYMPPRIIRGGRQRDPDELGPLGADAGVEGAGIREGTEGPSPWLEAPGYWLQDMLREERYAALACAVSSICHALGTPLNVIAGRATLVRLAVEHGDPEITKHARIIEEQVAGLSRLLWAMRDFTDSSGPESEPRDVRRRRTDLAVRDWPPEHCAAAVSSSGSIIRASRRSCASSAPRSTA